MFVFVLMCMCVRPCVRARVRRGILPFPPKKLFLGVSVAAAGGRGGVVLEGGGSKATRHGATSLNAAGTSFARRLLVVYKTPSLGMCVLVVL